MRDEPNVRLRCLNSSSSDTTKGVDSFRQQRRPRHRAVPRERAPRHAPHTPPRRLLPRPRTHHHHRHVVQPGAEAEVDRGVPGRRCGRAHLRLRPARHAGASQFVLASRAPATPVEGSSYCGGVQAGPKGRTAG